jgi:hypothetical protein
LLQPAIICFLNGEEEDKEMKCNSLHPLIICFLGRKRLGDEVQHTDSIWPFINCFEVQQPPFLSYLLRGKFKAPVGKMSANALEKVANL